MLLDVPLDSHPLEPNVELPPPSMLKRKIIIKNKKKHHHHHHHHHKKSSSSQGEGSFHRFCWKQSWNARKSAPILTWWRAGKKTFWLFHDVAYLHNLINQFFSSRIVLLLNLPLSTLPASCCGAKNIIPTIAANVSSTQPDKQQPPTIDENCATGSSNSHQQTGNGDIPQQHAPPLQVSQSLGFRPEWGDNLWGWMYSE